MKGYVYVMSNPAMHGIVKVGFTLKEPELRAQEMSAHEGLPLKMRVEYYAYIAGSAYEVEQKTHRSLKILSAGKEWFRCDVLKAVMAIQVASTGKLLSEKLHYESPGELKKRNEQERIRVREYERQENTRRVQERQRIESEKLNQDRKVEHEKVMASRLKDINNRYDPLLESIMYSGEFIQWWAGCGVGMAGLFSTIAPRMTFGALVFFSALIGLLPAFIIKEWLVNRKKESSEYLVCVANRERELAAARLKP